MAARSRSGAVFVLAAVLFSVNARPLDGQVNGPAPPSPISPLPVYGRSIARVTSGSGSLPNHHGQVWREYDLSPYTLRVTSTNRPEQAVVDWILRETGYELWHSEPLGILSASERTLRVYHTPQVQAVVAGIVNRFVNPDTETHGFSLRMITVDGPNWRSRPPLLRLLTPIQVQSPGAQAWLLEKEGVAALLAELRRRSDFREHNSPNLLVGNGQSTVIQAKQGRSYVRNLVPRPEMWPGYQPETGLINEGFALELSPLLSLDGRMIDASIKCEIDQVEDILQVLLDMPTATEIHQRTKVEVPQVSHFRFHERFRWPVERVLLVSMGMVPVPVPGDGKSVFRLPLGPPRVELLVLVDCKGRGVLPSRNSSASRPGFEAYRWGR